ncbi:MAG TPA: hypothetical protein VEY91_04710 [Candidatus Limnocylindria bacterium]|nr:hypothetical protein [Candidatus Limnocylindria bacterium]
MKLSRWIATASAVTMVGGWAVGASACDKTKNQSAAAQASAPVIAVTASSGGSCASKTTATTAVTAGTHGSCAGKTSATTAYTASHGSCASKKASATAVTASSGGSCAGKASAAKATMASKDHGAPGKGVSAMAAGSGGTCSGKGMTTAAGGSSHADCEACVDMSMCEGELKSANAHTQVVPLKNGVMFVYTADSPGQVRVVQAAMVRRGERISQFVTAGDKAHLCGECKSMRGAMASGKLTREIVNIEGGALTLMTSDDPKVVAKIHAMVDVRTSSRTKS